MGIIKNPRKAIFESNNITDSDGKVKKNKHVEITEPKQQILKIRRYFFVLSMKWDITMLPTRPQKIIVAPKILVSIGVYPNGSTRLLMIAPRQVYTP